MSETENIATEKLGVRVSDPAKTITIPGAVVAEQVLFEHVRVVTIQRCVAALHQANLDGGDERLTEVAMTLQAVANVSSEALQDLLRTASEQGLQFEIVPTPAELH